MEVLHWVVLNQRLLLTRVLLHQVAGVQILLACMGRHRTAYWLQKASSQVHALGVLDELFEVLECANRRSIPIRYVLNCLDVSFKGTVLCLHENDLLLPGSNLLSTLPEFDQKFPLVLLLLLWLFINQWRRLLVFGNNVPSCSPRYSASEVQILERGMQHNVFLGGCISVI